MAITGRIETVFDVRSALDSAAADIRSLSAKLGDIVGVPEGYRIEREERTDYLREPTGQVREVVFGVWEDGDDGARRVTTVEAFDDSRHGEWVVNPGGSTSKCEANEARARAVALVMAALEVERRNA